MTNTSAEQFATRNEALLPVAFEWNSVLSASASSGPLFALYLAMHISRAAPSPQWREAEMANEDERTSQLAALNHYRKSPLNASAEAIDTHRRQSELRQNGMGSSAWLEECMHPTPIHYRDAPTLIDEQVQFNCSLGTQWALKQATSNPIIDTDPTLLADIVESSQSML